MGVVFTLQVESAILMLHIQRYLLVICREDQEYLNKVSRMGGT